jgi:hypothetical protein
MPLIGGDTMEDVAYGSSGPLDPSTARFSSSCKTCRIPMIEKRGGLRCLTSAGRYDFYCSDCSGGVDRSQYQTCTALDVL